LWVLRLGSLRFGIGRLRILDRVVSHVYLPEVVQVDEIIRTELTRRCWPPAIEPLPDIVPPLVLPPAVLPPAVLPLVLPPAVLPAVLPPAVLPLVLPPAALPEPPDMLVSTVPVTSIW